MAMWIFVVIFFGMLLAVILVMRRGELVGSIRCDLYSVISSAPARIGLRRVGRESGSPIIQVQLTTIGAMRGTMLNAVDAVRLAEFLEEAAHKQRSP